MSKFLVGKTVNGLEIAEDKKAIRFLCDDGKHVARCDGDCCSNTWIEHVELPAMGFPFKVLEASDLDTGEESSGEYGDVIAHYGLKLTTDKGDFVLDYRNESNGYYGGNLSWPDDNYFYGGVYEQNVSNEEWRLVTKDI